MGGKTGGGPAAGGWTRVVAQTKRAAALPRAHPNPRTLLVGLAGPRASNARAKLGRVQYSTGVLAVGVLQPVQEENDRRAVAQRAQTKDVPHHKKCVCKCTG